MTDIVLFGAGASFGSLHVSPRVPPLGCGKDGLFSRMENCAGPASGFHEELKVEFRKNFENGMKILLEQEAENFPENDININLFLKQISTCLLPYTGLPGNLYERLISILMPHEHVYVSLNYDLILEDCAERMGWAIDYNGLEANMFRLLKIHGSVNFCPEVNAEFIGGRVKRLNVPLKACSRAESISRCEKPEPFGPAVAIYGPGKEFRVAPEQMRVIQQRWIDLVGRAENVYIVGVAVVAHDEHIWGILAKASCAIHYFGLKSDEKQFNDWKDSTRRDRAHFRLGLFGDSISLIAKMKRRKYLFLPDDYRWSNLL